MKFLTYNKQTPNLRIAPQKMQNIRKLHFLKCKIRFVLFKNFFMINIFCFKKDLYICQTIK